MNMEILITVLLVHQVSIGRASREVMDGWFTQTTVGELSLPFVYDLFEAGRNNIGSLKLWCGFLCRNKTSCYFCTALDDKCVLYVTNSTDIDSQMQPYTSSSLPDSTKVYRKQGLNVTLQKFYEIGNATVMSYDEAQTACTDLGMEMVTFASVQEFHTLSQLIDVSQVSGGMIWIGLIRQPDNTWVYIDGGLDIPELWIIGEPNGDGPCAHMRGASYQNKFNDCPCNIAGHSYICQAYTLVHVKFPIK